MTPKIYYVVNDDKLTRCAPTFARKSDAERVCKALNKKGTYLYLVSWQWGDTDGRFEMGRVKFEVEL